MKDVKIGDMIIVELDPTEWVVFDKTEFGIYVVDRQTLKFQRMIPLTTPIEHYPKPEKLEYLFLKRIEVNKRYISKHMGA